MEGAATTMTMAALLSTIGDVFTAAVGWMGDVADIVASHPLFLIPIVFGFIGVGVSLFSRLLRV